MLVTTVQFGLFGVNQTAFERANESWMSDTSRLLEPSKITADALARLGHRLLILALKDPRPSWHGSDEERGKTLEIRMISGRQLVVSQCITKGNKGGVSVAMDMVESITIGYPTL